MAWLRRRVGFLADPEPVESIETERVTGMAVRDMELVGVYRLSHRGLF